jgi:hypothetical protein
MSVLPKIGTLKLNRPEHVGIAKLRLLASVEPDRMDQMQVSLCSCHRDVEKAPLFVSLFLARAGRYLHHSRRPVCSYTICSPL